VHTSDEPSFVKLRKFYLDTLSTNAKRELRDGPTCNYSICLNIFCTALHPRDLRILDANTPSIRVPRQLALPPPPVSQSHIVPGKCSSVIGLPPPNTTKRSFTQVVASDRCRDAATESSSSQGVSEGNARCSFAQVVAPDGCKSAAALRQVGADGPAQRSFAQVVLGNMSKPTPVSHDDHVATVLPKKSIAHASSLAMQAEHSTSAYASSLAHEWPRITSNHFIPPFTREEDEHPEMDAGSQMGMDCDGGELYDDDDEVIDFNNITRNPGKWCDIAPRPSTVPRISLMAQPSQFRPEWKSRVAVPHSRPISQAADTKATEDQSSTQGVEKTSSSSDTFTQVVQHPGTCECLISANHQGSSSSGESSHTIYADVQVLNQSLHVEEDSKGPSKLLEALLDYGHIDCVHQCLESEKRPSKLLEALLDYGHIDRVYQCLESEEDDQQEQPSSTPRALASSTASAMPSSTPSALASSTASAIASNTASDPPGDKSDGTASGRAGDMEDNAADNMAACMADDTLDTADEDIMVANDVIHEGHRSVKIDDDGYQTEDELETGDNLHENVSKISPDYFQHVRMDHMCESHAFTHVPVQPSTYESSMPSHQFLYQPLQMISAPSVAQIPESWYESSNQSIIIDCNAILRLMPEARFKSVMIKRGNIIQIIKLD